MMTIRAKNLPNGKQWLALWRAFTPMTGVTIITGDMGTVVGYVGASEIPENAANAAHIQLYRGR